MRIRASARGGAELEASVEELCELRAGIFDLIGGGAEVVSIAAEVAYDPSPSDTSLSRLVVRRAEQRICVSVEGGDLRIVGSPQGLDALCAHLIFPEDSSPGSHVHYEYYADHPFISPDSMPLVVTVGRR